MTATEHDIAIAESLEAEKEVILDLERGNMTRDEANELLRIIKERRLALED